MRSIRRHIRTVHLVQTRVLAVTLKARPRVANFAPYIRLLLMYSTEMSDRLVSHGLSQALEEGLFV